MQAMSTLSSSVIPYVEETREWLRASGPDALRFLNGMWTCDLARAAKVSPGKTCGMGLLLSTKGKPVTEAVFLCESPESFLFSLPQGMARPSLEALNKYLVADEVKLEIIEDSAITKVLIVKESPLDPESKTLKILNPVPGAEDRIYEAHSQPWGLRVPRTLLGERHEEWWLWEHSRLAPNSLEKKSSHVLDEWRIDAGVPKWGIDFSSEHLPLEFPLLHAISYHKGCYLGQEVVARATFRGHMNRGFARFYAKVPLEHGEIYALSEPDRVVGRITTVSGNRGLGLVRLESAQKPTELFQKKQSGEARVMIEKVEILT